MFSSRHFLLYILSLTNFINEIECFTPRLNNRQKTWISSSSLNNLAPSKVATDDEPTPSRLEDDFEEVDARTLDTAYDENNFPVTGQPWRRGETAGLEDPIQVAWRVEAEAIIRKACETVDAEVDDVTWGLAYCLITVADMSEVEGIIDGPEVEVDMGEWYDDSPSGTGPDYFWKPAMSEEERLEYDSTHPKVRIEQVDDPANDERSSIDTYVLSAIAKAVLDALEDPDVEERLKIASRHEIMISAPGGPDVLNTQRQFDDHRGFEVTVETRDPWKSNRTLKGKLVQRTAMDVIINVQGNIVTIPNNFVFRVKLPAAESE